MLIKLFLSKVETKNKLVCSCLDRRDGAAFDSELMFLEKNPRYTPSNWRGELARSPAHHAHRNFGPPLPSLLQYHRNRNSCYGINSCYGFAYDLVLVTSSMTPTVLFKLISLIKTVLLRREIRKHFN